MATRLTKGLFWSSGIALAALMGFTAHKTRSVAHELTDPPFYRVQPLERVNQTYQELAQGGGNDPGGVWQARDVGGLQVWTLKRIRKAAGAVLLLHGFGDDRWGTSPALRWFPALDAVIFTYLRRDDALRTGASVPPVTFGVRESDEVVQIVHDLEAQGLPRNRILLMGRSLGASVGILALAKLEKEGPLGGIIWEGAPASSRDFAERLVKGRRDRFWHPLLVPLIGNLGSQWAAHIGHYDRRKTDLLDQLDGQQLMTPSLCFLATQDRLAPPGIQRSVASHFKRIEVVEVPTWHLNCSEVLGPAYAQDILAATNRWLGAVTK
jgi:pimeloyl-ACP methyl ester carboxylesterase